MSETDIIETINQLVSKEFLDINDINELIDQIKQLNFDTALNQISNNNYHLIKLLCNEAKKSIDSNLVTEIIKFINVIANEDKNIVSILIEMESFNWIIPNCFIVEETLSINYLTTLNLIFSNFDNLPKKELLKLDDSFLDSLIELALQFKDYYETNFIHSLYYTMFGYQKNIISDGYSPLILKLYSIKEAPEIGPEMISLLNRSNLEYNMLPQCLSLINDLFTYSTEHEIPCFFFTLDIKVLIDIIIREINNLDELDPSRWQFLEVLSTIIDHSEYSSPNFNNDSKDNNNNQNNNYNDEEIISFYKIDDIKNVLSILNEDRNSEKDPQSSILSKSILKKLNKLQQQKKR
ncbi:hypothetical protein DDB_G0293098 [Dictyostelium discoideum AX4]|uniref:SPIN90/Ldb17 leucine-rich domain-containing protein n=1 Tax=Dictyostelium discoideum TaxID=44689 RepID=Q54C96_DICDI|nr:hypothetical protein DDB_G0293098 [Dictyostelium discoideum AX4]EAL60901.1 hypothetical protein DDB_G0293098 [Dictyostelium discoideum AX4]|eukprot:XP_629323.1 hypothetical protein DDB_G0293098 [Dictyostelium discoideum AX4]